jgi:hypothetical protein
MFHSTRVQLDLRFAEISQDRLWGDLLGRLGRIPGEGVWSTIAFQAPFIRECLSLITSIRGTSYQCVVTAPYTLVMDWRTRPTLPNQSTVQFA